MNTSALVSIIIPIYKVESYLRECVESVINQTYQNLEIILVDDGSPDQCGAICDNFSQIDNRIKVLHKNNSGPSDARNAGMSVATGDFYFFLDSDDYIAPNTIECLMTCHRQTNADIVCASHLSFLDGETVILPNSPIPHSEKIFPIEDVLPFLASNDWGAWGKLYQRSVHDGINFPSGKIHEDEAIMFQLLDRCRYIALLDEKLYFYRQRENSITSLNYSIQKMDWFYSWVSNVKYVTKRFPFITELCIKKTWEIAMYNLDHIIGNPQYEREIHDIASFAHKYRSNIGHSKHVPYSQKIRLWFLLHSNPHKSDCLYCRFYNIVKSVRILTRKP